MTTKQILDELRYNQPFTRDEMLTFIHESAHDFLVTLKGRSLPSATSDSAIVTAAGRGATMMLPGSKKSGAVIGWAGLVAEMMMGGSGVSLPAGVGKLTTKNAERVFDYVLAHGVLEKQSRTDRMAIKAFEIPEASPKRAYEPFLEAVQLLEKNWPIVEHGALALARDCGEIVRQARIDPGASKRAMELWIATKSVEVAKIAAKAVEAIEPSESEIIWITATVPAHLR